MKAWLTILYFFLAAFPSYSQENYVIQPQNIPLSTPRQLSDWLITEKSLLGIRAFDPVNHLLNLDYHVHFDRNDQNPERWYPLLAEKQNMGATLTRYGTTESHGREKDWNLMLKRLPDFSFLFDVAIAYEGKNMNEWWTCGGGSASTEGAPTCMFAEVTPEHNFFYNNPWFQRTGKQVQFPLPHWEEDHFQAPKVVAKKDTVGVYGCFVRDVNHGSNPEIHPVQQIWCRDRAQSTNQKKSYWLFFVQDQSERFWDVANYFYNDPSRGNHPPADSLKKYRPWALSPVYGNFRIAFKIDPEPVLANTTPLIINLTVAAKREVVTSTYPAINTDADNGFSHSLVIGTRKVITVNEPAGNDNDIGIRFVEITKLADGSIRGYIEVSLAIGDYNHSGAGYIVLHADVLPSKPAVLSH